MFFGFFKLAIDTVWNVEQALNASGVPAAAGSLPTYRVYDSDGNVVASGTCTAFDNGTLTGAYMFSFSTASPQFVRGQQYHVAVSYTVSAAARTGHHHFTVT